MIPALERSPVELRMTTSPVTRELMTVMGLGGETRFASPPQHVGGRFHTPDIVIIKAMKEDLRRVRRKGRGWGLQDEIRNGIDRSKMEGIIQIWPAAPPFTFTRMRPLRGAELNPHPGRDPERLNW